ncbi:MAG: hypothetical protein JW733_02355 [Coriobacteriia bacterium]|nr:hypothetical protein [Coriobacteriia bacterium]MBN2840461.1 hypothetical protein [Coriobacteriia bacterium]
MESSPPAFLASIFLVRSARNLAAVLVLCEAGWAPEAQTLLRAMVEDMVTLAYISTDPDKLAAAWLGFENRRLPDREELFAALTGAEPPDRADRPRYERWTKLGFNGMAERADTVVPGLTEYLGYVYPILSDRAHGNTSASGMYLRMHPDGSLEPLYLPSDTQLAITLCNAVTAAYTTAERANALGVTVDLPPIESAEQRIYEACGLPSMPQAHES